MLFRKKQQRINAIRNHRIKLVVALTLFGLVVVAAGVLFFNFDEILDKAGSALEFSWEAVAGIFGTSP